MDKLEITNQEDILKKSATTGGFVGEETGGVSDPQQGTSGDVMIEEKQTEKIENSSKNYSQKPVEIAQQKYYESEKKLFDSKTACWNRFKTIMTIASVFVGFLLTFLGIFWAYNLNNIAEPIGGIKSDMQTLKDQNKEIKSSIQRNEDRLNETIEKFFEQKQKIGG